MSACLCDTHPRVQRLVVSARRLKRDSNGKPVKAPSGTAFNKLFCFHLKSAKKAREEWITVYSLLSRHVSDKGRECSELPRRPGTVPRRRHLAGLFHSFPLCTSMALAVGSSSSECPRPCALPPQRPSDAIAAGIKRDGQIVTEDRGGEGFSANRAPSLTPR